VKLTYTIFHLTLLDYLYDTTGIINKNR
jgi:hypothetical protein